MRMCGIDEDIWSSPPREVKNAPGTIKAIAFYDFTKSRALGSGNLAIGLLRNQRDLRDRLLPLQKVAAGAVL